MTYVYYHPIQVTLADGKPATIHWRGITYRVLHVNEPWHLMDGWWKVSGRPGEPGIPEKPGSDLGRRGPSDRTYYRLRCVSAHSDIVCEIYFDAVSATWILERVYD